MATLKDPLQVQRPVPGRKGGFTQLGNLGPNPQTAQGISEAGADISAGADELLVRYRVEEDRTNTLVAESNFNQLREWQLENTYGEENGFTQQRGKDAVEKPIYKEWLGRFDQRVRELEGNLKNQDQIRKFKRRSDVARLQYQEGILRHLGTEADNFAKETYDGIVLVEQQNAAAHWNDPNAVFASLDRINNAIIERAERFDFSEDYVKAIRLIEYGKVHSAVIDRAIMFERWKYAKDWFQAYRDQIDTKTAEKLDANLENAQQKQKSAEYQSRFLANEDSPEALRQLHAEVSADSELDDNRRNILIGRIQNQEDRLERRAELALAKRQAELGRRIDRARSVIFEGGFEPPPIEMQQLLDETEGTELHEEVVATERLATATRQFRQAKRLEQEGFLRQAEARARAVGATPLDLDILHAFQRIYSNQLQRKEKDPFSYGVTQGFIDDPQTLDLSKPADGPALQDRFAAVRSLRLDDPSIPFKPLTEGEVDVAIAFLKNAPVEAKRMWLGDWRRAAGDDTEGFMAIMAQIADRDPVVAVAGSHAAAGRSQDADILLRGQALLSPPDGGKPVIQLPSDAEMRAQFDNDVREVFEGNAPKREAHFQAAKAAYAAMSAEAGDSDTRVLDGDRWELATEVALGTITRYNGRRIVLPKGYTEDRFSEEARQRLWMRLEQSNKKGKEMQQKLRTLTPAEKRIVGYHSVKMASGATGRDEQGRTVSVYATGILVREGPYKGKYVSVPGFIEGRIEEDEDELYKYWKSTIDKGMWPMYDTDEKLAERSKYIHSIIEADTGLLDPGWTMDRLRNLPLQSIGDGRYVVRDGPGKVTDQYGNDVILNFNEPLILPADAPGFRNSRGPGFEMGLEGLVTPQDVPEPDALPPVSEVNPRVPPEPAVSPTQAIRAEPPLEPEPVAEPMLAPAPARSIKRYNLPDNSQVMGSSPKEDAWHEAVAREYIRGNAIVKMGTKYYSVPRDWAFDSNLDIATPNLDKVSSDLLKEYRKWAADR